MRNAILSFDGLDVEIRPKWTSQMDTPELFIHLGGVLDMDAGLVASGIVLGGSDGLQLLGSILPSRGLLF